MEKNKKIIKILCLGKSLLGYPYPLKPFAIYSSRELRIKNAFEIIIVSKFMFI